MCWVNKSRAPNIIMVWDCCSQTQSINKIALQVALLKKVLSIGRFCTSKKKKKTEALKCDKSLKMSWILNLAVDACLLSE